MHSPVNGAKQKFLNRNFGNSQILKGAVDFLLETKHAALNRIVYPRPSGAQNMKANFDISQFRHQNFETFADDPVSFFLYPVLDSFAPNAEMVGLLITNMYWRFVFSNVLPDSAGSFLCVVENSFNQTMSYHVNGATAIFLGEGDHHDSKYDDLMAKTDLNEHYAQRRQYPAMRSYTSAPLSTEFGRYVLKVYPTTTTEEIFKTSKPWIYTSIVAAVSIFTSLLFAAFAYYVERRQRIVMDRVVQNAEKAAATERDLNEYLAHGKCMVPCWKATTLSSQV